MLSLTKTASTTQCGEKLFMQEITMALFRPW
jgi:hypothetical protein